MDIAPGYFIAEIDGKELRGEQGEKLEARIPTGRFGEYEQLEGPSCWLRRAAGPVAALW